MQRTPESVAYVVVVVLVGGTGCVLRETGLSPNPTSSVENKSIAVVRFLAATPPPQDYRERLPALADACFDPTSCPPPPF